MSHIVEVRHLGFDHDAAKEELQRWLDHQGIQPMLFEHSTGGPGITFRVHFTAETEALAFAETFHGWLNDGSEPKSGSRWDIGHIAASCARPSAVSRSQLRHKSAACAASAERAAGHVSRA